MLKNYEEAIEKLRPFIIESLQSELVRIYKLKYFQKNKKHPIEEEIDKYINFLIISGDIINKADEMIKELFFYGGRFFYGKNNRDRFRDNKFLYVIL